MGEAPAELNLGAILARREPRPPSFETGSTLDPPATKWTSTTLRVAGFFKDAGDDCVSSLKPSMVLAHFEGPV